MSVVTVSVPTERLAADVGPIDGAEIVVWTMKGAPPRPEFDMVVPPYLTLSSALPRLAEVTTRVVQSQSIGYEGVAAQLPRGVVFANAATVHETSTAELALALTLAAQRRIPAFVRAQAAGSWAPEFASSLADRRVLLLGYGGVGSAVAARLAAFQVELTVVASHARDDGGIHIHGVDELPELLPRAEIVIVTLPGGPETHHIVDEAFLTALPDDALVVNVGRGPLIDTEALLAQGGRIRAALDVTDPEPLPSGHPLWTAPGVLISPHVGGASTAMQPRIAGLVRRQIGHLLAGEEPENVVIRT
ncbi:2-hydroxyacid dehydrogenase [Microbacterium invictum]|uniref:Phosphoglycerate dehydrogenase-like enzyme n=1 Tax=Microbacterium invictum TaxID=515415 RepID=A0AA40SQR1_9MICO|nr:2-hydroxyacid dehydrogenase [Microbacterium invictum]MBB4140517.1 phosphoglycerate dehydrogenase-like enzyme [Microbacterium invictum]